MTPIKITDTIKEMSATELREKLNYYSFTFCVNADFTKTEEMCRLIDKLEMYMMEGLLRVLESNIDFRPYQNKIYEHVENLFENQDAYNINRMMSSIRRTKLVPIDPTNEKYIKWMKNRVKYGVKTIMKTVLRSMLYPMKPIKRVPIMSKMRCKSFPSITCDITTHYKDRVKHLEKMVKKYKYDFLTGLMGKLDYIEKVDRLFEEYRLAGEEFYLGLVDINNLHNINRRNGYHYGDDVIKAVSDELRKVFRFSQLFRISGDEFAILIRHHYCTIEEANEKLSTIDGVSFAVRNVSQYTNPKQMFREIDKELSQSKSAEKRI